MGWKYNGSITNKLKLKREKTKNSNNNKTTQQLIKVREGGLLNIGNSHHSLKGLISSVVSKY